MIQENWSEKIFIINDSLKHLLPEGILTTLLVLTILGGLIRNIRFSFLRTLGIVAYLICILVILLQWPSDPQFIFHDMVRLDDFSSAFKLLILTGSILTLLISPTTEKHSSEYLTLIHAISLGSCLLAMSMNFIMVLISLELISLSSYVLAGFNQSSKSAEGSMKYFLFGTVATAVLIYGMSLLYGETQTLHFASETFVANLISSNSPVILLGGLLLAGGLLFKIAAVPFHFWAPDVYESSPTAVVAFFAVVPKLAGLTIIIKIMVALQSFGQTRWDWISITAFISIVTMIVGNVSALLQSNIKRMMGYSSIAQSGFLLMGLVVMNKEGLHFTIFYSLAFLLANFIVFLFLVQLEKSNDDITFSALRGKGQPWGALGIITVIALISLTGLPPTAGFTGKLFLFSALWESYAQTENTILLIVLIVGLINTVVSLFFYLKIPYFLYLKDSEGANTGVAYTRGSFVLALVLASLLLYFFVQPQAIMVWISSIHSIL